MPPRSRSLRLSRPCSPGAKVAKVNTISVRGRFRRQGMHAGYTAASKKAIVTLTKDSKEIEFFNSMV